MREGDIMLYVKGNSGKRTEKAASAVPHINAERAVMTAFSKLLFIK